MGVCAADSSRAFHNSNFWKTGIPSRLVSDNLAACMFKSGKKLLGPVAQRLVSPDRWTDQYPAWEDYAQELDTLLLFAGGAGPPFPFHRAHGEQESPTRRSS